MQIVERLRERAKSKNARIVLPEGDDPRVQAAAVQMADDGLIRPILITANPHALDLPDSITVIHPPAYADFAAVANALFKRRKHKGMTLAQAHELAQAPLTFATLLLHMDLADGCVAGAVHATSDVLRSGLQLIGMRDGLKVASSTFLMILPDGRPLTYGDCGMVPLPTAEQLATIAVNSAETHQQLTGEDPIVAMLSFSTLGSAEHPTITKVREATALARKMAPNLRIDGELQFDAAFVDAIGTRKAPNSSVAGRANVFIFPNLDAGNIAYKITERVGNAQALGPLIQGLAKPMHDLSRGCSAADIVLVSTIAAVQASA